MWPVYNTPVMSTWWIGNCQSHFDSVLLFCPCFVRQFRDEESIRSLPLSSHLPPSPLLLLLPFICRLFLQWFLLQVSLYYVLGASSECSESSYCRASN